ncbi:MAG: aminotransferase class I/II-fold pyridoxal phosphate-dependent enzyme, partial [Bacillota bacterium]|nr:aminotransferase class I/II-fold pyridoxal phosphate-dependent enzyme [Bacillota bacterium]
MDQRFIPLSVPNLKGNELEYVTRAIKEEWVSTAGPFVSEFEEKTAAYVNAKGAVSCQNGTSGIHIALNVCGVMHQDEVIVPALTFIATVNPVKYIGAEPIFMDCDDSLTMDVNKLMAFCVKECRFTDGKLINNRSNRHVKAIVVVHVFGNMANMEKVMEIAENFNLKVIEDATEAIGTKYIKGMYRGKHAGTIGDIGVYSYNGNKIMTTGGGGMIVSEDERLLERAKHLTTQAKSDELYYLHDEIGYNYRMTNLQAAMGLAQLEQLELFIQIKKRNYDRYREGVGKIAGLKFLDFNE